MVISKKCLARFTCRLNGRLFAAIIVWVLLLLVVLCDFVTEHLWKHVYLNITSRKRAVFSEKVVLPVVRTQLANCEAVINGDQVEINRTLHLMNSTRKTFLIPHYYLERTKNCSRFLKERMYINKALTKEEADFSIAYSIMIYKDIEQFERLLRAIYRPQNYYCIHADAKSPKIFHRAIQSIIACFQNVFMASTLVNVKWGQFTALEADIICMKDLWGRYKRWKYFINLTGQEFPLRTNNELVDILRMYNGTADVRKTSLFSKSSKCIFSDTLFPLRTNNELVDILRMYNGTADVRKFSLFSKSNKKIQDRIKYKYRKGKRTKHRLQPLPYDLTLTKGECHVALPRSFVDYVFRSWVAKEFLEWLKNTYIPDETYLVTLNNSPQLNIPGSYRGNRRRNVRFKNWQYKVVDPCHGKVVRGICINGVGDLNLVTKQSKFFVNKFHLDFQYLALDCLEEWFYNRTRAYYQEDIVFDVTPYVFKDNQSRT